MVIIHLKGESSPSNSGKIFLAVITGDAHNKSHLSLKSLKLLEHYITNSSEGRYVYTKYCTPPPFWCTMYRQNATLKFWDLCLKSEPSWQNETCSFVSCCSDSLSVSTPGWWVLWADGRRSLSASLLWAAGENREAEERRAGERDSVESR